jgi:anti-anti-sigma factor
MHTTQRDVDGFRVLTIHGELGSPDDQALLDTVAELLAGPGATLIIDLAGLHYLNSMGINTLVRITAQANVQEQRVVYAGPSPLIEGIFRTTQLVRFFEVVPDVPSAVARLSS